MLLELLAVVISHALGHCPPMKSAATLVVVLASLSRAAVGFATSAAPTPRARRRTSAAPTPRARTTALRALDDPVEKLSVDAAVILSALTSQRLVDEIVFKNADLLAPIAASDFDVLPGLVSDAFAWFCCWLVACEYRGLEAQEPDAAPPVAFNAAIDAASLRCVIELAKLAALKSPIDVTDFLISIVDVVVWLSAWRLFASSRFR